jgi:hypothetical protein
LLKAISLAMSCGLSLLASPAVRAADLPGPWVELGTNGALAIRSIVAVGSSCPQATADGVALPMQPRSSANREFPLVVCQALASAATAALTVGGLPVPALPTAIRRIVVIGDTGCRLKGSEVQDCNDPFSWPFATLARLAAGKKPDLVIHVGDYFYRETPCPERSPGCAGSPYLDHWPTWKLDLFDPAAPLLAAAPWVVVRGNHESCERGGQGWVRLLDPSPEFRECADQTEPYALHFGGLELLIFDSSGADDGTARENTLPTYTAEVGGLLTNVPPHAWLVTHRPFWALNGAGFALNATEQAATRGHVPPTLDMVLSGHVHDFTSYAFGPNRPAQLVVGDSGDKSDALPQLPITGTVIDGMPVQKSFALQRYGYFLLDQVEGGWDGALYGEDDRVLVHCRLRGRDIECA